MIRPLRSVLDHCRLTCSLPIWVSRPKADGKTHTVSAAAWKILVLWLVFVANALIWGGIAIYQSRAADRVTRKPPMHDKSWFRQPNFRIRGAALGDSSRNVSRVACGRTPRDEAPRARRRVDRQRRASERELHRGVLCAG